MKNILTKKTENYPIKKLDWSKIQLDMKEKLGDDIYESWLKKIYFTEEFNNYILISVSTRFIRDWITSRYLDQILQIIKTYKKNPHISLQTIYTYYYIWIVDKWVPG